MRFIQRGVAIGAMVSVLGLAAPAHAGAAADLGRGAALVVANVFYMPAKLIYALAGGVVAGCAYGLSAGDKEVVDPIVDRSFRGDYVLVGDHLSGRREIEFIGRTPEERQARSSTPDGGLQEEGPEDAGF